MLARRLAGLVDSGLAERVEYREPGRRARREYRLTAAGWDLRPVLLALMTFGDTHLAGDAGPPVRLRHQGCDGTVGVRLECSAGHRIEPADRLRPEPGPGSPGGTTGRAHPVG